MKQDYDFYKQESLNKFLEKTTTMNQIRSTWEQQVTFWKDSLEKEKAQARQEDLAALDQLADALDEEQRDMKRRAELEKELLDEIGQTNLEILNKKTEAQNADKEEARRLAQEYMRLLDERENKRKEELQCRMNKLDALYKWASESFMHPNTPSGSITTRVLREQSDLMASYDRRVEAEEKQKTDLDELTRAQNAALMAKSSKAEEEKQRLKRELGEEMQRQGREYKEYLRQKRKEDLEAKRKYGQDLLEQDKNWKEHDTVYPLVMTPVERSVNMDAIRAAANDPSFRPLFQSRISHRLRMSGATPRPSTGQSTSLGELKLPPSSSRPPTAPQIMKLTGR